MTYAIVIERSSTGYGAYVPDLPGCAVAGDTEAEVRSLIRKAIQMHSRRSPRISSRSRMRYRGSNTSRCRTLRDLR